MGAALILSKRVFTCSMTRSSDRDSGSAFPANPDDVVGIDEITFFFNKHRCTMWVRPSPDSRIDSLKDP